jgi:hypothetical protein
MTAPSARSGADRDDGGQSNETIRAWLDGVSQETAELAAALDSAGLERQLRQARAYSLSALDRGAPSVVIEDVLLTCEAVASVTGPSALATGELGRIRDEALRALQYLRVLAAVPRGRRLMGHTTVGVQGALLRSALHQPAVRDPLFRLMEFLSLLAGADAAERRHARRLPLPLPLSRGCLVPGSVLISAFGLIVFLLASVAVATGQVGISPGGLVFPQVRGSATVTPRATAGASSRTHGQKPTPTAARATPTSAPRPHATPTPAGAPAWSASPTSVTPCAGSPAFFSLVYTQGKGQIFWTASGFDTTSISVNPTSGALQPGGSVQVTVAAQQDNLTGTIALSAGGGLQPLQVTYDGTGC